MFFFRFFLQGPGRPRLHAYLRDNHCQLLVQMLNLVSHTHNLIRSQPLSSPNPPVEPGPVGNNPKKEFDQLLPNIRLGFEQMVAGLGERLTGKQGQQQSILRREEHFEAIFNVIEVGGGHL